MAGPSFSDKDHSAQSPPLLSASVRRPKPIKYERAKIESGSLGLSPGSPSPMTDPKRFYCLPEKLKEKNNGL